MRAPAATITRLTTWPLMSRPRIACAASYASSAVFATLTPPALPRPPTFTCALTTTTPPIFSAAAFASSGVSAMMPGSTGTSYFSKTSRAWYSYRSTVIPLQGGDWAGDGAERRLLSRDRPVPQPTTGRQGLPTGATRRDARTSALGSLRDDRHRRRLPQPRRLPRGRGRRRAGALRRAGLRPDVGGADRAGRRGLALDLLPSVRRQGRRRLHRSRGADRPPARVPGAAAPGSVGGGVRRIPLRLRALRRRSRARSPPLR